MTHDHADTPGSVTPREYFAAMAMQALLTRFSHADARPWLQAQTPARVPYELARMAFEVAGAMVETSAETLGQP